MALQLDLSTWQSPQIVCLVSKPDLVVIEVEVDRNAIGQEILDKVCSSIGTVEKDYFGLQYYGPKRELLWLNLRNRVVSKTSGQSPFRLRLRVKYFVEPHYLLQQSTRRLFYLQLKQDFLEGKLEVSTEHLPSVLALIAQIEFGDVSCDSKSLAAYEQYASLCPGNGSKSLLLTSSDLDSTSNEHALLKGVSKSSAISKFLAIVATMPTCGTESYQLKMESGGSNPAGRGSNSPVLNRQNHQSVNVTLRIGPLGVDFIYEDTDETHRIPFKAIQLATHSGKLIEVNVYQDDGSVKALSFRTNSESQSNALYRIITEMLAFYTWDTVHSSVIRQHSLDFKGHFLALFRPSVSDMDKHYIFDVQRTSREAYDNARRILYRRQLSMQAQAAEASGQRPLTSNAPTELDAQTGAEVELLKERLRAISDALTCRVCYDAEIDCTLIPCGHQVCCKACAQRCQACPVCRKPITEAFAVFLPITKDFVSGGSCDPSPMCSPSSETSGADFTTVTEPPSPGRSVTFEPVQVQ